MGFETVILSKVADKLGRSNQAEFCNGSLFVCDLTRDEAEDLQSFLGAVTTRKVVFSTLGNEYAFDFTAD